MELHTRVELIDTILEEAEQKMQALHHALAAQERAQHEMQHTDHGTPSVEEETLKNEQALWEKARAGLTELRTVLAEIGESEQQRGVVAKGAGV